MNRVNNRNITTYQNGEQGFTLIELMIVIAIVGILSSIAVASYKDYSARTQVTEAMELASAIKIGLAEYYTVKGTTNGYSISTNAVTSGRYVDAVAISNLDALGETAGVATVSAKIKNSGVNPDIQNFVITLSMVGGTLFNCSGSMAQEHLPLACTGGVPATAAQIAALQVVPSYTGTAK
ncbi:MAG: pilin [Magnetococcales bacterium]|nr:pilin [Magnetococcales bacterium]